MYPDVLELRSWYGRPLGRTVQKTLRARLAETLDVPQNGQILFLGYGAPYISVVKNSIVAMPAKMGVMHVPRTGPNRSLLVWEDALPFPDNHFDAVVLCHCLEHTALPEGVLLEAQRVLRPNSQLIAYVPNRLGLWARREVSPLAQGRPYSATQLLELARKAELTVERAESFLFFPPTRRSWVLRYAASIEKFGAEYWLPGGGLLQLSARKSVMHGTTAPVTQRRILNLVPGFGGATSSSS